MISHKEHYSLEISEKKLRNTTFYNCRGIFYIDKQYSDELHSQNNTFAMYDISQRDSL
jgi:hypothetical protein